MQVAINHLTRMKSPYVCVAGVDRNGSHIRPVLEDEQLHRLLLQSEGGPFSLGAVVDLGPTTPRPDVPEVEDVVFVRGRAKRVRNLDAVAFRRVLEYVAKPSLGEIFDADWVHDTKTALAVATGAGRASLGVLRPVGGVELTSRQYAGTQEIRFCFSDSDLGERSLKVTDIRLWEADQVTPSVANIDAILSRLDGCYIAVGLTRGWPREAPRHWLQVNNIFPKDDPLWARD